MLQLFWEEEKRNPPQWQYTQWQNMITLCTVIKVSMPYFYVSLNLNLWGKNLILLVLEQIRPVVSVNGMELINSAAAISYKITPTILDYDVFLLLSDDPFFSHQDLLSSQVKMFQISYIMFCFSDL
jgi:hypothetical protein